MDQIAALYEKYCHLSNSNGSQPVRFDDAFGSTEIPSGIRTAAGIGLSCHYSARAKFKEIQVSGTGSATIVVGFSASIENLRIHVTSGDLFLFVGPFSEIKDLTIGSFNTGNYLHFGAGTTITTGNMLVQGSNTGIFFGHDCMFSTQCHARTSDSHSIFSYETRKRINRDQSIKMGDHVWIGRHVNINKGSRVGDDVILGQGSIVSGEIFDSSCFAGVPAKCLKKNVTWERDRIENLDDINKTYHYRPRQLAVNRFLKEDLAFHPRISKKHDEIRKEYQITKNYPWIPSISYSGSFE